MYKLVAILLLCFAASQASSIKEEQQLQSAADEAKELYYKLLEVVGEAITQANDTANSALDAIKEYAVEIETAAKDEIQGLLDDFQAQFDELNEKAAKAGLNITECRKYEVQFSQLPDTLLDEIVACVNHEITAAQNNITDAMNRAMKIQQDFYNIEQEIDDCGSGLSSITCLAKLVVQIGDDTLNGPSKISTDIDNTVETVKEAWPRIKQCAEDSVEKVPSQATTIVKNFAECVALP